VRQRRLINYKLNMEIGLIIQDTITGLDQQYDSGNLHLNPMDLAASLTDERLLATQLANHSNVYSIHNSTRYKVFSLLLTNVSDFVGRAGFIAIRLYVSKGLIINDIHRHLHALSEKYLVYKNTNTLHNQSYDDLLNAIVKIKNDQKEYISIPKTKDAVFYVDDEKEVEIVFRKKECNLFHSVYVFRKSTAVDINIAIEQGMVPLAQRFPDIKEIQISDPHSILMELRINGHPLGRKESLKEYCILCWNNDVITYNTYDEKSFRKIHEDNVIIRPKPTPPQEPPPTTKRKYKTPPGQNIGLILVVAAMLIAVGFGILYLVGGWGGAPGPEGQVVEQTPKDSTSTVVLQNSIITFDLDTSNSKQADSVFKTDYEKLKKYRFKIENGYWLFKNIKGKNRYDKFYLENVSEIEKIDSLDASEKEQFSKALSVLSDQKLTNRPIVISDQGKNPGENKPTKVPDTSTKLKEKKKENPDNEFIEQMKAKM
jgi:hypothetical protein